MKNLWDDAHATTLQSDLDFRVYSSNLLGQSDALVLHGGGNTSVKSDVDGEEVLFVKGSGWDLVSIKHEGFAPVKMTTLLEMAQLPSLSDSDMVTGQKAAMIDPTAPNPSVEAILHALIPFKYVDHTHADAVVTISNSKTGIENIQKIFPNFLIVPYVMPGFILAQRIYEMSHDLDWDKCEGIILHNHGIFTFDNDPKIAYTNMINAVTKAEQFLQNQAPLSPEFNLPIVEYDATELIQLLEQEKGHPLSVRINTSILAKTYASQNNLKTFATRGVLTPEHIIRTKRVPLIIEEAFNIQEAIDNYKKAYQNYFETYATNEIMLNSAPNYTIIKDFGVISFGKNEKEAGIIHDIVEHTMMSVLRADKLGGYQSISLADSFEMEYWELEQAKLKK